MPADFRDTVILQLHQRMSFRSARPIVENERWGDQNLLIDSDLIHIGQPHVHIVERRLDRTVRTLGRMDEYTDTLSLFVWGITQDPYPSDLGQDIGGYEVRMNINTLGPRRKRQRAAIRPPLLGV